MTRVPQQTERPMATVQLTVVKSEADYFKAEVPVCSAGFGVFLDRVHLQWSVPWDVWLTPLVGVTGLKPREREKIIFLHKTAQLPAGIKMWRQLWSKRKRPPDYTHRVGKPTMYSIFELADGHEEGSQEGHEPDGRQNRRKKETKKPYKETELGVNNVPRPASMNGVGAKENE